MYSYKNKFNMKISILTITFMHICFILCFYVGYVDKSSLTLFHCNTLNKHHHHQKDRLVYNNKNKFNMKFSILTITFMHICILCTWIFVLEFVLSMCICIYVCMNVYIYTYLYIYIYNCRRESLFILQALPLLYPYYTLITPLLHPYYTLITSLLHPYYTLITTLLHPYYTPITPSLHPYYTLITLLLHSYYTLITSLFPPYYTLIL
jgi:hypothetical protein